MMGQDGATDRNWESVRRGDSRSLHSYQRIQVEQKLADQRVCNTFIMHVTPAEPCQYLFNPAISHVYNLLLFLLYEKSLTNRNDYLLRIVNNIENSANGHSSNWTKYNEITTRLYETLRM